MEGGEIGAAAVVSQARGAIAERMGDETVILVPVSGRYARLNRSGGLLWDRLARPVRVDTLSSALSDEYEIDRASAEKDLRAFLAQARALGIVTVS